MFITTLLTLFPPDINPRQLLDLSARRCYFRGKELVPLPHPPSPSSASLVPPTTPSTNSKLSATLHLLQHTSEQVAAQTAASRHYFELQNSFLVPKSENSSLKRSPDNLVQTSCRFDPRFLVFEFVSSFLLRKRQIQLVKDFVKSAQSGDSSVQQVHDRGRWK